MNRKQEDALVRLAFGDTTPEEASALEQQAFSDPDSARALATYRRMREGLKDLHDVPADQLSKERLRNAILSRGLRPKPVQAERSWLWMPAMAAVLVFAITMVRHGNQPSGGPLAIQSDLMPKSSGPLASDVPNPAFDFHPSSRMLGSNPFGASEVGPAKSVSRSPSHRHAHRNSVPVAEKSALSPGDLFTYVMPDASRDDTAAATGLSPAGDSKDAIIIIGPQKDGDTGAATATEVKSPTHVVTSG